MQIDQHVFLCHFISNATRIQDRNKKNDSKRLYASKWGELSSTCIACLILATAISNERSRIHHVLQFFHVWIQWTFKPLHIVKRHTATDKRKAACMDNFSSTFVVAIKKMDVDIVRSSLNVIQRYTLIVTNHCTKGIRKFIISTDLTMVPSFFSFSQTSHFRTPLPYQSSGW